jgi:hypothetical protein
LCMFCRFAIFGPMEQKFVKFREIFISWRVWCYKTNNKDKGSQILQPGLCFWQMRTKNKKERKKEKNPHRPLCCWLSKVLLLVTVLKAAIAAGPASFVCLLICLLVCLDHYHDDSLSFCCKKWAFLNRWLKEREREGS